MNDETDKYRREVANFRFGVIADLIHGPRPGGTLAEAIREKSRKSYKIPGSRRTRVAETTIRSWLRAYRHGRLDALLPKTRKDAGAPRRMSSETIEALLHVKRSEPRLSVADAVRKVRAIPGIGADAPISHSSVHRLYEKEGISRAAPAAANDLRRFEYEYANELWMADVMHAVSVRDGQRRRKTYLIDFIDDASRVVPHASFEFSESAATFMGVFKKAVEKRGIPKRLFVDNGSCFRSDNLALACAKLNVALIHGRPYHCQGRGKIERFHRTCRARFVAHLCADDTSSLEAPDRKLRAWIEGEYHRTPHQGIGGQAPIDKWARCAAKVRLCGPETDLDDLFLFEARRRVYKDRTVHLNGRLYEADVRFVGRTVTVRYDPCAPPEQPVTIVSGDAVGDAYPLDLRANARARREKPKSALRFSNCPGGDI